MALRFQKRFTVMPGVRLNFGKRGVSLSLGPRGSSVNVGREGVHGNLGLTGTGLSVRNKLSLGGVQEKLLDDGYVLKVGDDGRIDILTAGGDPVSSSAANKVKKARHQEIISYLSDLADEFNLPQNEIMTIHHFTPKQSNQQNIAYPEFSIPKPTKPKFKKVYFWHQWLGMEEKIKAENQKLMSHFQEACNLWGSLKNQYDSDHTMFKDTLKTAKDGNIDSMDSLLGFVLKNVTWVKETQISYEFIEPDSLYMDVDLPGLDAIPKTMAEVATRGYRLNIKPKKQADIHSEFSFFVHSIIFRIVGEVFNVLPALNNLVISGYIQVNNPLTGVEEDIYILSVSVPRSKWLFMEDAYIADINPELVLEGWGVLKNQKDNKQFEKITPFSTNKLDK
jgi:hypothetical protein